MSDEDIWPNYPEHNFEGWNKSIGMSDEDIWPNYPEHNFEGWNKSISTEMTFGEVDPDVLSVLTGGVMGTKPAPTFSVEVGGTIPWKWWQWQWWLRRPRRSYYYFIPNAQIKHD